MPSVCMSAPANWPMNVMSNWLGPGFVTFVFPAPNIASSPICRLFTIVAGFVAQAMVALMLLLAYWSVKLPPVSVPLNVSRCTSLSKPLKTPLHGRAMANTVAGFETPKKSGVGQRPNALRLFP